MKLITRKLRKTSRINACCSLLSPNWLMMILMAVFLSSFDLTAQITPLGTPATQNPDGTTDTPGTPAACASGFNIYSIDHEDATIGFLPGGFCVTTDLVNNGTTAITVTGTPNGAGIGDVDNIVVGGGRINYSSTDGGDLDATYTFCEPVTNPYVFIGDLETFTTINFFDGSGSPISINLMNGQSRFATSGNSALITGTTSTNQDGYVQVPGTYSTLVINIDNPPPFTLDVIQIAVGVCMPDPPIGAMTCPYDLMLWKKDDYCAPVYRDANGVIYEKDQNNNNIASLGDELWTGSPICGTLELLEENAIDDIACMPQFTCDAAPAMIEFKEPTGSGCLYSTYWYDITSFPINSNDPGNQWSAIFSGTDAFGLPAHPSTPTTAAENCGLDWLGDNEGTLDFDDEANGANEDEQLQMDGWLYVASHVECIRFRIGSSATDHSVGLFVGPDLNNMTLVTSENDNQADGGNNSNGVEGSYCIPASAATTCDDCGWKILRVRIYAHDDDTAYDPAVDWSFNGGLTWDVVEEQWFTAATSASDNMPPTGTAGGGCNPVGTTTVGTNDVLVDLEGNFWDVPGNCNNAPSNLYEVNIPNGNNAEEGDHLSLVPYCYVLTENTMAMCDPCQIEFEEDGCACDNPDNTFAGTKPTDVTMYHQTLTIISGVDNSFTFLSTSGISNLQGPFPVAGSGGTDVQYTYLVAPGTPYSITVQGDVSGVIKTFTGECSIPDACNCPPKPEICGDGLDNDCDGAVDAADSDIVGNCVLDCDATPVEIQGRELITDGKMTHQVWSRECGNTACCSSSINPHSCALAPFSLTDLNGLPAHQNGAAGCTGDDVFSSLGSVERRNPQLFSLGAEQAQLDGWIVLPPGITCFDLKVNHPRAWDAQAVYLGPGIASMNFVGGTSFPPLENQTSPGLDVNGECNGTTQGSTIFNYDTQNPMNGAHTTIMVAGCTWTVIRARAYIFDESYFHVTPVQWNLGDGFVNIPAKYLQSVGPAGWDTDDNIPTSADVMETAPFCAFEDADGDLFLANGDFYALDEQKCEQVVTNDCLSCPDNLAECEQDGGCVQTVVDAMGNPLEEVPVCNFEVFQVTPRNITPSGGNGLTTIYWDHNQANGVSNEITNSSIYSAFNAFDATPATCPNCLPQHPDYLNATGTVTLNTLGVAGNALPQDADNDNFRIQALNRRSGENAQQDGWLLLPEGVDCIEFRLSSQTWDAGALYLGTSIDDMTLVGDYVNPRGGNDADTFIYNVPTNASTIACAPCTEDLKFVRVRAYHHDNNMGANTVWEWNLGNGFVNVPESNLYPVPDQCDNTLPSACPTISDGQSFLAVRDMNGLWFSYSDIANMEPFGPTEQVFIPPCSQLEPVCGTALENLDTRDICSACCTPSITCPDPGTFDCGDDAGIAAWLDSYMTEVCMMPGTTVTNDYDFANFDKCVTTTNSITFTLLDASGAVLDMCSVDLTINAAPPAVLTPPTLPTSLSCIMAETYMAPEATFANGLMGACENSGTIQATQVNNFTACGGTITVSYSGLDDCGNTLTAGPFTIMVDAAPVPTVTAPPYSSPISCEQAANYVVLDATYTNGLSGICNISGNLPGTISNNFDACGGTITLTYAGFDPCQRPISIPPIVIDVQPAPVPMITPPALPSSIACDAAADYMPPNATYDNGLTGVCNLSGTATAFVNRFYDACGGSLEVIYEAEDDCGRNIPKNITIIPVDPAPVPTVNVPAYPASLTCSEAEALTGAYATYDNGEGDDCNISGFLAPTVLKQVDACTGGTVTISYNGTDDCGNVLSAAPIVIPVTPAGPATIHLPQDANPIYCWEAPGYVPENAKYSNGESGFCENSGELVATTVIPYWNNCDGGVFMVQYTGFDDCGNYLESDLIAIAVLPDTWAPIGTCVDVSEIVADIKDIPGPNNLAPYMDMILANYSDYCGTMVVNIVGDSGEPVCGLDGTFARVYEVQVSDECGNNAESCTITFGGDCNPLYCTLTEDFYASDTEQFGAFTSIGLINELLGNGTNPITVGGGSCGLTFDNGVCVQAALSGAGQSISLPSGVSLNCGDALNNNLAKQVLTTILNIRYNAQILGLDYGNFQIDAACIYCPSFIHNALPANATINDLLDYANGFLSCQCTGICGEYDVNAATALTNIFLGLNSRFDKCQVPGPCYLENGNESGNDFVNPDFGLAFENGRDRTGVTLFPNPTDRQLNMKLNNQEIIGKAGVVEIFNVHGVKVLERKFDAFTGEVMNFDLYGYSNGLYWLSVKVDGFKPIAKKFLVTKL